MMRWYGGGMGGGAPMMWIGMGLFWIALIALIIWLVVKLLPGSQSSRSPRAISNETPAQILDRMFAVGEIDEQTYRSRRSALTEMGGQS